LIYRNTEWNLIVIGSIKRLSGIFSQTCS